MSTKNTIVIDKFETSTVNELAKVLSSSVGIFCYGRLMTGSDFGKYMADKIKH